MKNNGFAAGFLVTGLAIVIFVACLPMVKDVLTSSYTLNSVTNESVIISASKGQLAGYPLDTSFTPIVTNSTHTFTVSTHYNITTVNGTMFVSSYVATTPIKVTYKWQPSGYLTDTVSRTTSQTIFMFVILGLLVFAVIGFGLTQM